MHNPTDTPKGYLMDHIELKPRPYRERSVNTLLYLKAVLEQDGELGPVDLLAALAEKGVIV